MQSTTNWNVAAVSIQPCNKTTGESLSGPQRVN
jgi:hypothetical protein